jgi:tRNA pseudouridine13 synthase
LNRPVKLRRVPEDFQVEELTGFAPCDSGAYSLYRLTKRGIGTPEAIEAIIRRFHIERRRISWGGLKDRHALTRQYLTIRGGPRRGVRQTNLHLEYLGRAPRPFGPRDLAGNRFQIVVRGLSAAQVSAAEEALAGAGRDGLPNYFDDQRFRSVGESGRFVARSWIEGDYETALWLALAEAGPSDPSGERREKEHLRARWGEWAACKEGLQRSHRRSIVTYLADHPADFRGAFARLRADLRSIWLAALQSYLWNRLLAAQLLEICGPQGLVPVRLRMGPVPFMRALDDHTRAMLDALVLPLPSSRLHLEEGPLARLVERSLEEVGLSLAVLRVRFPRDSFFSKGWRPAIFRPLDLSHEPGDDELDLGRRALRLRFALPRGSYATILLKRIALPPEGRKRKTPVA